MSYKVILAYLDPEADSDIPVETACELAVAQDAHLIGLAISQLQETLINSPAKLIASGPGVAPYVTHAQQRLKDSLDRFEAVTRRKNAGSIEKLSIDSGIVDGICRKARYCDLLILPAGSDQASALATSDLAKLVLHCGVPVVLVPRSANPTSIHKTAMVAWDGSASAARSIRSALPLLKRAEAVYIVMINGPAESEGAGAQEPGASLASYLQRHGIRANIEARQAHGGIGPALLAVSSEINAGLLVMGCHGHSPIHEKLFGGATQAVLKSLTLPVLMSH